jgi:hypothetical protein
MNLTSIIQANATFGDLLVGFAFAGLCVYIARKPGEEKPKPCQKNPPGSFGKMTERSKSGRETLSIEVRDVTAAVFFAMVSLAMSSFLYSNLVGITQSEPRVAAMAVLSYGIIFALSVLSLFYGVVLMMLESESTAEVAKTAYWVVTIAGTVIVLRFLADSARDVLLSRCRPHTACNVPGVLSLWGIGCTLLIAALLSVLITVKFQEFPKSHERELGGVVGALGRHPAWPPGIVFIAAVLVTTLESLYFNTRSASFMPSDWLIYSSYSASLLLVALFALACGRVVAPRAEITVGRASSSAPAGDHQSKYMEFGRVKIEFGHVKAAMYIAIAVVAILMFCLAGRQRYLVLWIWFPAIVVMLLVWYSCPRQTSNSSGHNKQTTGSISSR